jgi:hypothetical protein
MQEPPGTPLLQEVKKDGPFGIIQKPFHGEDFTPPPPSPPIRFNIAITMYLNPHSI